VAHFWPGFRDWLGEVADTRDQDRITYRRQFLTWMGLMAFALKLGSRRQVRFELDSPEALENLNRLSGSRQETIAHGDTLDHFLGHVPTGSLSRLRRRMVQRLVRMKALDEGRLRGRFLVGVDGTGQLAFGRRHCPRCLESTVHGQRRYFHQVLEAKLLSPQGLAISLASEFIENAEAGATAQDCELKAFVRLAERLKKDFPQLPLCLCLDALYANGTVMEICERNGWKYIITFKEGSLPALWREYRALKALCPGNRKVHHPPDGARQAFAWVEGLEHVDDRGRAHRFHAFECREEQGSARAQPAHRRFAWLTNFAVSAQDVVELANRGGRCRWKIENEGFNIQKNGGFNLEHAYGTGTRQMRNWYLLLQIAHMILQLVERGSLLSANCGRLFGSLRGLSRRLAESLRNHLIPLEALDPAAAASIQIRLNTS